MIAIHPPMGWNSWDCYGAAVTEDTVRKNAEYMAAHLKDYGWEYIVVDIQWYQPTAASHDYEPFADLVMDGYGRLMPAENRFPSAAGGVGFKPLAEAGLEPGEARELWTGETIQGDAVHGKITPHGAALWLVR